MRNSPPRRKSCRRTWRSQTSSRIYFEHLTCLARPSGDPERSVFAIAGDDDAAKHTVTAFLDAIGSDTLDAGRLSEGWHFQRDTAAYNPYLGESA
ncbi:hypothetical protein StoSoilB20_19560 [Arthrobacter sp. StoSoilB20]|nr:hypothetical protein StoSoilB20_19560 [Arthrobacter sp. StoSoilB20]